MTTMREEVEIRFRGNSGPDEDDDSLAEGEIAFLSPSNRMEDDSSSSLLQEKKALFRKAYQALAPGPLFRFVVYLYGERKLMVFFLLHFVATIATWLHFGLIKWDEQKNSVPEGADFYWAKRLVPSVEFGSMHAILLQMALIPLTMSRLSIASLTDSIVDRFVPLNRMLRIHIHLGYVMVLVVFFSTVLFFIFFGTLCANGDESFCDKMTSEIMCTGYGILSCLLIIAGTSYFRHNIPYEVFYGKFAEFEGGTSTAITPTYTQCVLTILFHQRYSQPKQFTTWYLPCMPSRLPIHLMIPKGTTNEIEAKPFNGSLRPFCFISVIGPPCI